jgi:hypothetical protein
MEERPRSRRQSARAKQVLLERHGVEISRKTMGGWMSSVADLLNPLYQAGNECCSSPK